MARISYSALVIGVLLLGVLPGYLAPVVRASPTSPTVVSVFSSTYGSSNITDTGLVVGSQFTIDINVDNAPSFNGYEFALFFDASFLQAVSTDASNSTVFNSPFVVTNLICPEGAVEMAVVNLGSVFSGGGGTLTHITFKVLAVGVSPLVLAQGTSEPSYNAGSSVGCGQGAVDWTRLVSPGDVFTDVSTSAGYFSNVAGKLGPVARFTFMPSTPIMGNAVTFNATKSFDPDGSAGNGIKQYLWDFGDGVGTASGAPIAQHVFKPNLGTPYVGNFSVRLTVVDSDDSFEGMVTQLVAVVRPAPLCPLGLLTVLVPGNCPTITSAIDSVVPGGTIEVGPGTYQEHLSIVKTLNMMGAGSGISILKGSISISAPNVRVVGLTVLNDGSFPITLSLDGADRSIIANNTVTGPDQPPFSQTSRFQFDEGIALLNSVGVTISNNTITNEIHGFTISASPDSIVRHNIMANNLFGFGVTGSKVGDFAESIDTSNTIDGKPVYYLENTKSPIIPGDAGFVGLINVQDLSLVAHSISGVDQGILLVSSKNVTISGFKASSVEEGLSVLYSSDVTIRNLSVTNTIDGGEITNSTRVVIEHSTLGDNSCIGLGLSIFGSMQSQILNNSIPCGTGLVINGSNSNEIAYNFFSSPFPGSGAPLNDGIDLLASTSNEFRANHFSNYTDRGINLYLSPANLFEGNVLENSPELFVADGISLFDSPRNIFRENAIAPHTGLSIGSGYSDCIFGKIPCRLLDDYVQYIDSTNTIGGKPIYYLVNYNDFTVPPNAGFVAVVNSTNVTVRDVNISFNDQDIVIVSSANVLVENANLTLTFNGIFAWQTVGLTVEHTKISVMREFSDCISIMDSKQGFVSGNTIDSRFSGNDGIDLWNSTSFTIQGNYVTGYRFEGIGLFDSSSHNTIYRNTLDGFLSYNPNPSNDGVSMDLSSGENLIVGNTIANNVFGLVVSTGNIIYSNNFLHNFHQAAGFTGNTWDNGTGQGNYWSDYKGQDTDGDGVGDTLLPQAGVDNHPLISPWSPRGLAADFTGRAAWPEHQNFIASKDDDGLQALFTKVTNNGPAPEWIEGIFNITSADGSSVSLISGPAWLEPGATTILTVAFRPSSGAYRVVVQAKFSSDAYISWASAGTKSFSFRVVGS